MMGGKYCFGNFSTQGEVEELITYNQLLDHPEADESQDNSMDQDLYRVRVMIGHRATIKQLMQAGLAAHTMFWLNGNWGDHIGSTECISC